MDVILIAWMLSCIVFIIVQGTREKLTYCMGLISSGISLGLAGFFIVIGTMYLYRGMTVLVLLSLVSLLLAYRLIRTDLRTWRWFRERQTTK